jgi:hypothetical protein
MSINFKSFWAKVKQIAPIVDKSAVIASAFIPGKAGQIAGDVAQATQQVETGLGVVGTIVDQLTPTTTQGQTSQGASSPATVVQTPSGPQAVATTQQVQVVAASTDDHEARIKQLETMLADVTAQLQALQGVGE